MKHLIILLLFLISCTPREKKYDCTATELTIFRKIETHIPSKGLSRKMYYLVGVSYSGDIFRFECSQEEYQFAIIGVKKDFLLCKDITYND